MVRKFIALILSLTLLAGCSTPNFSRSATPASLTADWQRFGITEWRRGDIYSVGSLELGYLKYEGGYTIQVDPGTVSLKLYYYANRGNAQGLFWQTDPVQIVVDLKPNGKYKVQGEYGEDEVRLKLVDLETNSTVGQTELVKVIRRPAPQNPSQGGFIPIFIPKK